MRVKEFDSGPLGIESPIGILRKDSRTTPSAWVMNTGTRDSFFDVFFEIRLPNNALKTSDSVRINSLAPGANQRVTFRTVMLDQAGTFTTRVYTVQAGDADTTNNLVTGRLAVVDATLAPRWQNYR